MSDNDNHGYFACRICKAEFWDGHDEPLCDDCKIAVLSTPAPPEAKGDGVRVWIGEHGEVDSHSDYTTGDHNGTAYTDAALERLLQDVWDAAREEVHRELSFGYSIRYDKLADYLKTRGIK